MPVLIPPFGLRAVLRPRASGGPSHEPQLQLSARTCSGRCAGRCAGKRVSLSALHCCRLCPTAWTCVGCHHWASGNLVLRKFTFVGRKGHFCFSLSLNKCGARQGTQCWPLPLLSRRGDRSEPRLQLRSICGPACSRFLSQSEVLSWGYGVLILEGPCHPYLQ